MYVIEEARASGWIGISAPLPHAEALGQLRRLQAERWQRCYRLAWRG